jgi:hypothetical protein
LCFVNTRAESVRKKIRIRPTYADANMGHPFVPYVAFIP